MKQKLMVGLLLALAFYLGFVVRAKAYGGHKVDITKVSPTLGGTVSGHIEGFSCVDEADVSGMHGDVATLNRVDCYVLTSAE